ncbi:hypothetical protein NAV28_01780 [Pseudomonas stutzeri]|nr:hypothetical protein [Stutzerimonas degradans]
MARRHFEHFEALSSAIPLEDGYQAIIAVQRRGSDEHVHIVKVADGRRFDLQSEAQSVAEAPLNRLREIDANGEPIWEG